MFQATKFVVICYGSHNKIIQPHPFKVCFCLIHIHTEVPRSQGFQKPGACHQQLAVLESPVFQNTGDQNLICFRPPTLERVRKRQGIQSNVICHPGKWRDEKSPIIGLLSRGNWKIIIENNTKAPRNRRVLIWETVASEKESGMKLLLWIFFTKPCVLYNLAKKNYVMWISCDHPFGL